MSEQYKTMQADLLYEKSEHEKRIVQLELALGECMK